MNADKINELVGKFLAKKNAAIITLVAAFVVIIGGTVALTVVLFGGSDDPEPVGGDDPAIESSVPTTGYAEIIELMDEYIAQYQQQKLLTVTAGECSVELSAARASAPVDFDGLREYLSGIGVDPDLVADYRTVASAMNIEQPEINTEYIAQSLDKLQQNLDPGGDGWYEVRHNSVVVHRGNVHLAFDKDAAIQSVADAFQNEDYSGIVLEVSESKALDPDWDQLYSDFCYAPVNAKYDVDENGNTVVVESADGMGIDIEAVKESYRTGDWEKMSFYGYPISPEVTTQNIDTDLFQDVLGTKTTTYDVTETSRTNNVELAASSIDGCIILPGYKFSFNNAVGERTEERGYQDALIYVSDGVEPGLGGGICQVSSTLYVATLEAELKQELRECHKYTVFYVPFGLDATVAWGNIDYIFSNNTGHPIKIQATAKNGSLTISILGTADYESKSVTFRYKITETYPQQTITTVNETLAPGTKDVKSTGRSGYKVESYRTIVKDGVKYAEEWIATSIYEPLDTVVIEGPPLETTARVTTTAKTTTPIATPPPATEAPKPVTSASATSPTGTLPPATSDTGRQDNDADTEPPVG